MPRCRQPNRRTPAPAQARARKAAPARRGPKILAALVAGASVDDIAESGGLTRKRVESCCATNCRRRWVAPAQDYARAADRAARSDGGEAEAKAEDGDLPAIDRLLKILDRLDRYHGFSKLDAGESSDDEGGARRLIAKINAMAARMTAARKTES